MLKLATATPGAPQLWVRVNSLASGLLPQDLAAVCGTGMPAGVMLPKVSAPAEIIEVAAQLAQLEARPGIAAGTTRLLVLTTETPQGLLNLPQYPAALAASPQTRARMAALTWGAEDLGAALGSLGKRTAEGALTFTFQLARTQCLLAAARWASRRWTGSMPISATRPALERELAEARRDGFAGKLAIHPGQVAAINSSFTPSAQECAHARRWSPPSPPPRVRGWQALPAR